ncbi:MAG TPA: flavin reductase family protein, partial [Beijerinckiaceae bacterium]|nr:flavin reductase family protein [Beijerinckiaceae bacterium]
ASSPPMLMFSSEGEKDSVRNVRETGEFCCNIVSHELMHPMNATSAPLPRDTSEFGPAQLTPIASTLIRPPRVKEARAALECRLVSITRLMTLSGVPSNNFLVIGQVVGVHIDDGLLRDGKVDAQALKPLARLGYKDYAAIDRVFELGRPPGGGDLEKVK